MFGSPLRQAETDEMVSALANLIDHDGLLSATSFSGAPISTPPQLGSVSGRDIPHKSPKIVG